MSGVVARAGLLPWIAACYVAAAFGPGPALELRRLSVGVPVPALLLGLLLFLAGLGVEARRLLAVLRRPAPLVRATAAAVSVPVLLVLALTLVLPAWLPVAEWQPLLVGLALVAAMPVAGSSAAWCQHAGGDLALSVGLIVLSTVMSPLTAPLALALIGAGLGGEGAAALGRLAGADAGAFLGLYVLAPSLAGMLVRSLAGPVRLDRLRPVGRGALLLLLYLNAAVALPAALAEPDGGRLGRVAAVVGLFALATFAAGWALGRWVGVDRGGRLSLMFGLGMANNGTGLVLAASALGHWPQVMLPLLIYNLAQHVLAAAVERRVAPAAARPRYAILATTSSTGYRTFGRLALRSPAER